MYKVMKPLLCLSSVKEPKYFTLKELCKTSTGLDNYPNNFTIVNNLRILASVLDTIREEAKLSIVVNSGYRSPEVNRQVGGVPTSLHQFGRAADIRPFFPDDERSWRSLVVVVKRYESLFAEVIYHDNYIHVAI